MDVSGVLGVSLNVRNREVADGEDSSTGRIVRSLNWFD